MRLAALKTGYRVPDEDFDGIVRSVFDNACNIAIKHAGLITLVPAETDGLPSGITVDANGSRAFCRSFAVGAQAASRGGVLRIAGGKFSFDLRDAERWRSRLSRLALDMSRPQSREAWEAVCGVLAADGRGYQFVRIAGSQIGALVGATRNLEIEKAGAIAEQLIGLGEGGTPAGDDFLVGFLAALHCAACGYKERQSFVVRLGDDLRRSIYRTNEVSAIYLEAAIEGEVSEKLTGLAARIVEGAGAALVCEAAVAAIAVGHTSGADGTLGLLTGLTVWGTGPPAEAPRRLAVERAVIGIA